MFFHRILDFKMGWISILALFYFSNCKRSFNRTIMISMKKLSVPLFIMICFCLSQPAFSQSKSGAGTSGETTPMQIGSLFVNVGVGFGAGYDNPTYTTPFGFKIAAEYGMWQAGPGVITIGPELGGTFSGETIDGASYHSSTFVVAGRAAWHYGWNIPGLDTYGGFSAGIGFNHYTYFQYDHSEPIPYVGAFAGASYFITPSFGFNSEFGYDITNFQIGVVLKIQ
jgi:hypothetical protein